MTFLEFWTVMGGGGGGGGGWGLLVGEGVRSPPGLRR